MATDRAAVRDSHPRASRGAPSTLWWLFLILDAALIIAFAAAGNRSHHTGLQPIEIFQTAWPFLVGLLAGWALSRSWRRPHALWPQGVLVVGLTVSTGMVLRVMLTDGGSQWSFVMVATAVIAVFLLGRRIATRWITTRRRASLP